MAERRELPEGWEWKRLGDVASVGSGNGAPQGDEYFIDGEFPFVRTFDVGKEKANNNLVKVRDNINNRAIKEHGMRLFPAKTLLIPKSGASTFLNHRALLGKPAYVSSHLATVNVNENLLPEYLFFWSQLLDARIISHDVNYPSLKLSEIESAMIPLPTLPMQHQIVDILEKAVAVNRKRQEANALTGAFLKSVFYEMFGDTVRNERRWEVRKLGELCTIRRGASPRPIDNYLGGTVPWIKIGDGTKGNEIFIDRTSEKIIEDGVKKSVFLKKGALIFANCGVSLGFARILNIDGCIHDGWLSLEDIDPSLDKIYLLKLINGISDHLRRIAPEGTQPNLNTGIMKNFEIPLPPLTLQQQFARVVESVERIREWQVDSGNEIDSLCNGLMQQAFAGKLVA